jgi:hypothetical protein
MWGSVGTIPHKNYTHSYTSDINIHNSNLGTFTVIIILKFLKMKFMQWPTAVTPTNKINNLTS